MESQEERVVRYRGIVDPREQAALKQGKLVSLADHSGIRGTWFNRNLLNRAWHSLANSQIPPSQFVSVTRSHRVAGQFGTVYEFEIRKQDLIPAYWNPFAEEEDLVLGGTPVFNAYRY
jgi:hypothetical protein